MAHKLLGIFTSVLLWYIWGWIWGWSLVDPNLDLWALLAGAGALGGLAWGVISVMRANARDKAAAGKKDTGKPFDVWIVLLCATFGMFIGWAARTMIFGDIPGGPGLLVMLAGVIAGVWIGARPGLQSERWRRTLLVVLYTGFFGGFLVDMGLRGLALSASIPRMALIVIACGALGGAIAWLWKRKA
jgi:hypothetical protein